jgi:hopanoid biosynthesis associated protein HpnK
MSSKLIVNADDFGLTEGINKGIIECFCNGVVTRASLIVNTHAFTNAVELSRKHSELKIGVHLTLTEEIPVTPSCKIKSLVGSDGKHFKNYKVFLFEYLKKQINLNEVYIEFEAQIEKIINQGIKISHIDSHQHLHLIPEIFEIVKPLMEKFGIENIRIPNLDNSKFKSFKEIFLMFLANKCKKKILNSKLCYPDNFWGLDQKGDIKEYRLLNFLNNTKPGVTEIMCHPGFVDGEYISKYSHWHYNPEGELNVLTNPKIKETVRENQIQLIS